MDRFDVVIVGGGIAGSALASVLAPAGMSVLLLERVVEYRDKVRGEYMQPWGAVEMLRMDLAGVLTEAGGGWCRRMIRYNEDVDPAVAESTAVPLDAIVKDSPGGFCVGHPQASEWLSRAAAERGAVVRNGVSKLEVSAGAAPSIRYAHGDAEHDVDCRFVVGADGRHSSIRKALGIDIMSIESKAALGGLLVRADDWDSDAAFLGEEGEQHFLAFPRPGGYVRLYSTRIPSAITSGPDRGRHLLEGFRLDCVPLSERLAEGEVAGPCAYVLGSDAWTDNPAVVGGVLVGDAAGWSDPILGCGLSVAMRDARSVADVLLAGDDWSPDAFEPYAVERAERMRRIRMCGHLATELSCTFTPEGRARRQVFPERMASDPLVFGLRTVALVGPERAPADSFTDEVMARALAPA